MSAEIEPLVFLAGVNKLGGEGDWPLSLPGEPGPQGERRSCVQSVAFERAFRSAPVVHVGVVGFDISNHDCARLQVRAVNITESGFDVMVETWLNSRVWSVDVSWFAIGS